jgi:hypothetical protein
LHWTTHVVSGAAVGYLIGHPVPAALAGFAGHIALDTFPHDDPAGEIPYVIDSLVGAAFLVMLAKSRKAREFDTRHAALAGAIGAGAPDLELLAKLVTTVQPEDYLYPTHNGLIPHRRMRLEYSLATQAALIALTGGLAFWKWKRLKRA